MRAAIHVKAKDRIGGWRMCTDKINYHPDTESLLTIYPTLMYVHNYINTVHPIYTLTHKHTHRKTYRTLIFNGDVDGCVPYNGNEVIYHLMHMHTNTHVHAIVVDPLLYKLPIIIVTIPYYMCLAQRFLLQEWTSGLGFTVKEGWRPWTVDDQVYDYFS